MIEVLFIAAVAVVGAVLGIFIVGRRYRQGEPAFSPVEVEWLKKEAEGRISAISPPGLWIYRRRSGILPGFWTARSWMENRGPAPRSSISRALEARQSERRDVVRGAVVVQVSAGPSHLGVPGGL